MIRKNELSNIHKASHYIKNYRKGINKGLYKILSKMGISTITSYRGAQLFEAVGLSQEIVDLCFKGTPTRIQGTQFKHLHSDQVQLSKAAFNSFTEVKLTLTTQMSLIIYAKPFKQVSNLITIPLEIWSITVQQ